MNKGLKIVNNLRNNDDDKDNNFEDLNGKNKKKKKIPTWFKLTSILLLLLIVFFLFISFFYKLSVDRRNSLNQKTNYIYIKNYTDVDLKDANLAIKTIVNIKEGMSEDEKKNLYREQKEDYIFTNFNVEAGTDKKFSDLVYGFIRKDSYMELSYVDKENTLKRFNLIDRFSYSFKYDIVVSLINYDEVENNFIYTVERKEW